ncbi:MAG: hypothetical protein E4H08_00225 [Candidatus Atribacteria bacterium]|nr:MAG: hypothetical protein E4H08_00225 [Candidatus Atribacteria bacterium]
MSWFNPAGSRLRLSSFGDSRSFDYGEGLIELDNGDLLVCGAKTATSTTHNDAWLLRVSSSGRIVWDASLGDSTGNEWMTTLCQLTSGKVAVAGHTLAAGAGKHDILLLLVDPNWQP